MAVKKKWHKPEVIIIAADTVNGGGNNPTFTEGGSLHIINKYDPNHIPIPVSGATFNRYIS
ncbi:hypothetical protein [Mucilaginibacter jinjuensis]|uniref:Uncharacterized protein n=1 Tax=Mucilaginibacter jinjuensis TaxID=1176721 RepID=A0ABY7TDE4_9SPHI|nr:hypothetical protein [Mucilaginibacter jinjuensis]WCT14388.1 hypothetical protein PQO05_10630 [Mucilaginibacter jinjuensis]